MQVILKEMWKVCLNMRILCSVLIVFQSPRSRDGVIAAAESSATFPRFVMLLINDTTYLLDESTICDLI